MSARWIRLLTVALVVFMSCPLPPAQAAKAKSKAKAKPQEQSAPVVVETAESTFPVAELTVGFQTGDSENEGIGDLMVPVWNPGGKGLLFLNPRTAINDDDEEEYNIGVGYRQLLPKQKVILGANAYYDYRDTGYTTYDQWGVGFEILSSWIDARANYYDPEDSKYIVDSQTETETRQSVQISEELQSPYAEDHAVLQDYVRTRTVITETYSRTYEQYEQALGGYDWEIGLRLPLPVKQEAFEARVFGGYYDFDRDFGDDAKGWKARAELRVLASLFLDAGAYENEDLTGSDWFAGARFSVPLDLAKISQGRNPFATAKSRLQGAPRDFDLRLTEMVMRDPQVRLEQSKFIENKALADADTARATTSQRQPIVLLPDVNFVDGDVAASGDGSAERPYTTIQQGADNVFGSRNVYVYNASRAYEENVVLAQGTTLWGSGSLIYGLDGQTFGSGIAPVIDGMSRGPAVTMADRTTVRGFTIQNTEKGGPDQMIIIPGLPTFDISRVGIYGNNATDLTILENTFTGNETGVLLARTGDFNLRFQNNSVVRNELDGMNIFADGAGTGTFNADISGSTFSRNNQNGVLISANDYGFSLASVRNSRFNDNLGLGLQTELNNSDMSMFLASGVEASRNTVGILNNQNNNLFSLANISGTTANNNLAFGIQNVQFSELVSIGIIGMPDGLDSSANALASMVGFALPAEVGMFLAPSGPVTANNNGAFGVQSIVVADSLALGALFDITANNNGVFGIQAVNQSDTGVAIGLAGSSQNLSEILQLGTGVAGLFGLDLPLSITGGGHMEANGNGMTGFQMTTIGSNAAINAVVGLETVGNGGAGAYLGTYSDYLSIAALARLNSTDNLGAGLLFDAYALDEAAIGILADVNASRNGDSGITASVDCPDGSAILVGLSTDLIRPLAATVGDLFLGAPITIPGEPFGPIVASGNTGNGVSATVTGDGIAAAVFLDTQANGNSANGFNLNVVATNGIALSGLIASDVVLGLVNDMGVLPEPIDFSPIGRVTATSNGANGVLINQVGLDGAYSLLAGVEADGNLGGDGINANLSSSTGDVYAILVDTDAADNADDGIDLSLVAYGYAISALVFPDLDFNGDQGVHLDQTSLASDSFALLSGGDAQGNGGVGLWYNVTAVAGDAAAMVTDTDSDANGGRGGHFAITADGEAALMVGTNALPVFDDAFAGFFGADLLDTFGEVLPQGPSRFRDNEVGGLQAEITSINSNAWLDIDGAYAAGNTNHGFNITLTAMAGDIDAQFNDLESSYNGGSGINLELNGGGGTNRTWFSNLETRNNGNNGINVVENYNGAVEIGGERIVSTNNTANGVRIVASGLAGLPILDFGGGALGSLGLSSIYGNGNRDFRYNNGGGATVMAENNWWGVAPPVAGQFAGSIDRTPWLVTDPNAP